MKKSILLILLVTLTAITAKGQSKKFNFGVRGGLNYSNISGLNSHYKTAFYAGVYGSMAFTEHYALQPELTISQQGTEASYTGGTTYFLPVKSANDFLTLFHPFIHFILLICSFDNVVPFCNSISIVI